MNPKLFVKMLKMMREMGDPRGMQVSALEFEDLSYTKNLAAEYMAKVR